MTTGQRPPKPYTPRPSESTDTDMPDVLRRVGFNPYAAPTLDTDAKMRIQPMQVDAQAVARRVYRRYRLFEALGRLKARRQI